MAGGFFEPNFGLTRPNTGPPNPVRRENPSKARLYSKCRLGNPVAGIRHAAHKTGF
jgi:hypothetical protein